MLPKTVGELKKILNILPDHTKIYLKSLSLGAAPADPSHSTNPRTEAETILSFRMYQPSKKSHYDFSENSASNDLEEFKLAVTECDLFVLNKNKEDTLKKIEFMRLELNKNQNKVTDLETELKNEELKLEKYLQEG